MRRFLSKGSQRRMVNYASQRTVHFLSKGVSGKCSFTILKLNPLLGALLLSEEGEKKSAGSLFRHFREKRLTVVQACSHKSSFCLYWNETTNSQENFLTALDCVLEKNVLLFSNLSLVFLGGYLGITSCNNKKKSDILPSKNFLD